MAEDLDGPSSTGADSKERHGPSRLFDTPEHLTSAEVETGLGLVLRDGLASQAMATMTTGVFLVGLALSFNASNSMIGVLAAVPFLAQLLQLPALFVIERVRVRRIVSASASGISRLALFVVALSPLLPTQGLSLTVLVAALLVHAAFGALSACAWNSWMRDLVPEARLGSYFATRTFYMTILGLTLSLLCAGFIEVWNAHFAVREVYAYSILFLLGGGVGLYGAYIISRIPEPRMAEAAQKLALLRVLTQPLGDPNFRRLVLFLTSWNFAVNLAAPFFTVYMLKRLEYPMSLVIGFTVLSQVANVSSLRAWGKISDRFSNKSVLAVCGPLFVFCILGWTFTTFPEKHALTLPILVLLHVLMGMATAGVTLASGNIALKLSPRGSATSYLAANSAAISLAAGIAPIVGGLSADFFALQELSITVQWRGPDTDMAIPALNFRHWDFFFFFAFALGLYSLHRLTLVKEVGEVEEHVVVRELLAETRRSFHSLSSAAGLRTIAVFPFALVRNAMLRPSGQDPAAPIGTGASDKSRHDD